MFSFLLIMIKQVKSSSQINIQSNRWSSDNFLFAHNPSSFNIFNTFQKIFSIQISEKLETVNGNLTTLK